MCLAYNRQVHPAPTPYGYIDMQHNNRASAICNDAAYPYSIAIYYPHIYPYPHTTHTVLPLCYNRTAVPTAILSALYMHLFNILCISLFNNPYI